MSELKKGDCVKIIATRKQQFDIGITLSNFKGCKGYVSDVFEDDWCSIIVSGDPDVNNWDFKEWHLHKVVE